MLDINALRQAYERNENITKLLSGNAHLERQEIIEISYDIQSGSYTKFANANREQLQLYALEIYELCKDFIADNDLILDCGAGELTTLSALSQHLPESTGLLACDISLSRLLLGRRFAERVMRHDLLATLDLFVADMGRMPLADNSVDVVFTSHALEPNHGRETKLLKELVRVARRHLILFEPSWEHATPVVRERMVKHGYIRDLPRHIEDAGGQLLSVKPLPHPLSPINPTYCYIVEKKNQVRCQERAITRFQCPKSGFSLQNQSNYLWSLEGAWAYPVIERISCLRTKHGVLMSHG